MRQTVLRCQKCGQALERGRWREFTPVCFCLPLEGEPVFVAITNPREILAAANTKLVQRE